VAGRIERTGTVRGAGVELFARWIGEGGPIVVVLHGGPGASMDYLRPQFDLLATGRTLLYYDQRGGGRSEVPREAPLDWRAHVADLEAVLTGLDPRPTCVAGFSWGGLLAILHALEHPGAVRRLALVAPAPTYASARAAFDAEFARRQADPRIADARAALSASGLRERDPDAFWHRAFELSVAGYFRDPARAVQLTPFRVAARVQQAVWHSLAGMDLRPRLGTIVADTLILHGRHDPVPLEASEALAAGLPRARLEVFEDSGHTLYTEETGRFVALLDPFLPGER
jgi:proline iminopeptidase